MVVSSFAIGALAIPVFDLGFVDSLLTIFFINCLAITPVAFFSTFGPRFGLRQMVLSRFYFGYYGVKLSKSPHSFCARETIITPSRTVVLQTAEQLTNIHQSPSSTSSPV